MVARRDWTREWWSHASDNYVLVTSLAVLDELNRGNFPGKIEAIELISGLLFIPIESVVAEIVEVYIQQQLMPKDPLGDALHLALASYHKCDFLLTWNCRHLANANKFGHIRRLNVMLGLFVPTLVTPLELIGAQNDEE
ncbi:MAG: type II toxin-antitoxin system VapC family toxin [Nostoc sp.]|uniref:type II toxin-antitoxin system VapC family toxin n=1 Tax=Nostoc sp. TaxID=1180 RepID=UPI002FF99E81